MFVRLIVFYFLFLSMPLNLYGVTDSSPLAPVKTDTPQDTMRTFMEAMNQYRLGRVNGDPGLKEKIARAVRTLDLNRVPVVIRAEFGVETAIFLKEVIDRVIVIDYEKIPPGSGQELKTVWRLKDTEIKLIKMTGGDRQTVLSS